MYLRDRKSGDLVEVLDTLAMVDPCQDELLGRFHAGEELQDPADFSKDDLVFPSGETLPRCWVDASYRTSGQHL
ncbi:MAG: acetyltransferase [Thiogranum sp.]|nr:acetyltransferase [Thiogranum sp.]